MDQPGSQQACGNLESLPNSPNYLVGQRSDELEAALSETTPKWSDNVGSYVGYNQISSDVPSQAVPLFNPRSYFSPKPHPDPVYHWHPNFAASPSFGQHPGAVLPLSAIDAEYQSPANEQELQQNVLLLPQSEPTAKLNSNLIPYADATHELISGFEHTLTSGAAPATQRLGESHSFPQRAGRCVRCWALRKKVFLFI